MFLCVGDFWGGAFPQGRKRRGSANLQAEDVGVACVC